MRLADFIENDFEPILEEWEAFAAISGPAGRAMDHASLRDHAKAMLKAIVMDLRTPQTDQEQADKSKGQAPAPNDTSETAAQVHGADRAEDGFTVGEMTAEYRALRASVIRLWTKANGSLSGADLEDLMRFNETIDQSLAESLDRYTLDVKRSKEIYLAILGHDLRTPLGAVLMSSEFLLEAGELNELGTALTTRIVRASKRMNRMVKDLLDFTASRLGGAGMPITRALINLALLAEQSIDELRALCPKHTITLNTSGELRGNWDAGRLSQVLSNLLGNAVSHGTPNSPIHVSLTGTTNDVSLSILNYGPVIPPAAIATMFSPFKRLASGSQAIAPTAHNHLGLGLYIVERIVTAHGGTIVVTSAPSGTVFTITLPR